ncbi:MAG TPA: hypothetical protein VKA25_13185, partial [Gemmatimonadales bacterium]|nr:hypothetical protein [Gemmatimonadales bacterium]
MIRFLLRSLLYLGVGCVILALGALLCLYAGADTWLVNRLARTVVPGGVLHVGGVGGNYFTGIELRDATLNLTRSEGQLRVDTVRARYSLPTLLAGNLVLRRVQLIAPSVILKQSVSGSWNPFPRRSHQPDPAKKKSSGSPITVEHFSIVRGRAAIRHRTGQELPIRLLEAEGSLGKYALTVASLRLTTDSSGVSAHGSVPLPEAGSRLNLRHLDLSVDARRLSLRDLSGFRSELDRDGSVAVNASARGQGSHAAVDAEVSFPDGGSVSLHGVLTPPKQSPVRYRADAEIRDFNPALLLTNRPLGERVNGRLAVDVAGESPSRLHGRVQLEVSDSRRWAS